MVFVGHNGSVLSLSIHPFTSYIISSSIDKTIKIWSLDQQDIVEQYVFFIKFNLSVKFLSSIHLRINVDEPVLQVFTEKHNQKFITYSSEGIKLWKINHIYELFTNIG